jgi:uncharacterized membrane protein HdeD (DUF308 family)
MVEISGRPASSGRTPGHRCTFSAGIGASVFFGWLILFSGIAHLVYAWSLRGARHSLADSYWRRLPYRRAIHAGDTCRRVAALTLVLAFYIALEGAFELAPFSLLRRLRGAALLLIDGLVSLLLPGLILFHWSSSSLWAVGTLVGISLLLSGIARLTLPMGLRTA